MLKDDNKQFIFTNKKNEQAFFTQILVRNYLENEYKDANVELYGELINDIDVFELSIENRNKLRTYVSEKVTDAKTVSSFLCLLDTTEYYIETVDVKYSKDLMFKDLLNLITKIEYPKNTSVQLLYVSSDIAFYKTHQFDSYIERFKDYKKRILELDNDDSYVFFNTIVNDSTLTNLTINEALNVVLFKIANNKAKANYKRNITDKEHKIALNNFSKVSLRELTLDELTNVEMTKDKMLEEYGVYRACM